MVLAQPSYYYHCYIHHAVLIYCTTTPTHFHTPKHVKNAYILGCLADLIVALFFMYDNMIDNDAVRFGKEAWHVKHADSLANDMVLMIHKIYYTLEHHFHDHPNYRKMQDILMKVIGQGHATFIVSEPVAMARARGHDWTTSFTEERLVALHEHKGAIYMLVHFLPILYAGYDNEEALEMYREMLRQSGFFYTRYDDYHDAYGHFDVIGRQKALDIRSGQMASPIVLALSHANSTQREILRQNYGRGEDEVAFERVMSVFEELNIQQRAYEKLKESAAEFVRASHRFRDATGFPVHIYDGIMRHQTAKVGLKEMGFTL